MRTYKALTAMLAALAVSVMGALSLPAAESQSESTVLEETEAAEVSLPAGGSVSAGIRPAYKASDYVKIKDDSYKELTIRLYPPADDSDEEKAVWKKELDTNLMTQLYSLYPVNRYPADLESYVVSSLTSTYQQYAEMYGMDFDTFLSTYLSMDESTFAEKAKDAADKTLKEEILLSAIAEKEGIFVTDEDYQKGLESYAAKYVYASADALLSDFDEATVKVSLLMDKTLAFLETANNVEEIVETEAETESETAAAGAAGTPEELSEKDSSQTDAASAEAPADSQ